MLYIDQPNEVGWSYDTPMNGTLNITSGNVTPLQPGAPIPNQVLGSLLVGTFPTGNNFGVGTPNSANTTQNAARALWHFAQVWFQEFPAYKPNNNRISIFTESYGGRYGPAFEAFFQEQNERIANGSFTEAGDVFIIHLDTLGIINGCIDAISMQISYAQIQWNNTYGIQTINQSVYEALEANWLAPGGCLEGLQKCYAASEEGDPNFTGANQTVIDICNAANCLDPDYFYQFSGRDFYDFAFVDPDPFPPNYFLGLFSQPYIQQAIGARVNFTETNLAVNYEFAVTNDGSRPDIRGGYLDDIAYLLDSGIKVALIYGDR
jgi:hypothetical protein